tara:strand:- start:609 stop:1019 length:411 start_codon:yes stop_codon:yes gene_type:complete
MLLFTGWLNEMVKPINKSIVEYEFGICLTDFDYDEDKFNSLYSQLMSLDVSNKLSSNFLLYFQTWVKLMDVMIADGMHPCSVIVSCERKVADVIDITLEDYIYATFMIKYCWNQQEGFNEWYMAFGGKYNHLNPFN